MLQNLRILLDLDGTVARNAGRKVAARQFGITIGEEHAGQTLIEILGMDRDQFWAWWHANQDEIYGQAVPMPEASAVLQALKQAGAFIAVVTARRSSAEHVTRMWLRQHGIPHDMMVMDADDKVAVARKLALNVGFEDDPAHAVPLADLFPMALFQGNKNLDREILHPQIERLTGWPDVMPWLSRVASRTA
jgi:uncharacterized HAD superfamily protein